MLHAAHRQEIISYSAVELWLLGSCVASRANHSEVLQWAWRPAQPLLYRFAQFLVQLQHVDMPACATVTQFVQFGDAPPCKELGANVGDMRGWHWCSSTAERHI